MSTDHKPGREDEAMRIRDAGGFVINNRVMGELAVSRAFGDAEFKKGIKVTTFIDACYCKNVNNTKLKLQSIIEEEGVGLTTAGGTPEEQKSWDQPLIISEPDVEVTTLTDEDNFLVLACDGLYDVFTNEEVVTYVKQEMEAHGDCQRCCQVQL